MASQPAIHGNRRTFSASRILEAVGDALSEIRADDRLTWSDLGKVMGKSDDQAAKYADGSAEMGVTAFAFAAREWKGRFTGRLDALLHECALREESDRGRQSHVLRAALALSIALEDDEEVDVDEVRANKASIINARDSLNSLLNKLPENER